MEVKWAQLASPKGEVREGFWVLQNGVPIHDKPFDTREEFEEWAKDFNWF